jgi:hypothetical protein
MSAGSVAEPNRPVSIVDAFSTAITWSRDVLFRPFDAAKWFVLGFCAWLAGLGERGGGPNLNWNVGNDRHLRGDLERGAREAWYWLLDHLIPILFIAAVALVLIVTIWLLFLWLSSRGKFLFLDGVVLDRGAVVEPWNRYRAAGNALFLFRILVGLSCGLIVLMFLLFSGVLVWAGITDDRFGPLRVGGLVGAVLLFVVAMIVFGLVRVAINDFVVPLMYLRGDGVGAAWRELGRLFSDRPGTFVLYVLLKIAIAIVIVPAVLLLCCLTCCLIVLPYIGVVLLLPYHVFVRAFPLCLLGQMGPDYARFATLGPARGTDTPPREPAAPEAPAT